MRAFASILVSLLAMPAFASTPIRASLEQLARGADHILIGRIVGVDMVDKECRPIRDPAARTGPGLTNTIRLHLAVDEVLVTNAKKVPPVLKVPIDPFLHYTLGQIQAANATVSKPLLVLLAGPSFQAIVPGAFLRPLDQRQEALRIYRLSHPPGGKGAQRGPGASGPRRPARICD